MASVSLVFNVAVPAATGITFTPASPVTGTGPYSVPAVAAGTVLGSFTVTPSGWAGILSLSGANASLFSLNGTNLLTATALVAGAVDTVVVTPTP